MRTYWDEEELWDVERDGYCGHENYESWAEWHTTGYRDGPCPICDS